jgi:tetratricopeptide (TPR) repeat protein
MRRFLRQVRGFGILPFMLLLIAATARGQDDEKAPPTQSRPSTVPSVPVQQKPPALVDPAGPAVSLETSEALFDVAVALNECGYDEELEHSDPLRQHVRDQVNQFLQGSAEARDARDKVCAYVAGHRLGDPGRNLAQYISLALYLTPPPDLTPSVELTEMPPDSTQVVEILPLLRTFAQATDLHAIWITNREAYEEEVRRLHDPLTRMILAVNVYLKMPAGAYDGRRFLVVLEPMLAPTETNARVYGTDYVVVASPVNGTINMQKVRHTYLHYEIEPLLFARAASLDRLLPVLKIVRDAPLDYTFRSDIVALVIESMIKAVEARTLETGIPVVKPPTPDLRRADLERADREYKDYLQNVSTIRQQAVNTDMSQGYVFTQYFYDAFGPFEHDSAGLKESIGEMVYGMDVEQQIGRAKHVQFAQTGDSDVVRRAPRQMHGLDLAEMKLIKGDKAGAAQLAQQALDQKSGDPAYANYILGQTSLLGGNMDEAEKHFSEAIRLSKDPRTLAWAHIYLGRIHDVQEEREEAVAEYKAALTVRDGQADTKLAAEKGLKQPFALPHHEEPDDDSAPAKPPSN